MIHMVQLVIKGNCTWINSFRYSEVEENVLIRSKNLNDESLFEMINEIDHWYEANRDNDNN